MLTEDLLQLAQAYKGKAIEEVKKLYSYIEEKDEKEKEKIIAILRKNNFHPFAVKILLSDNEKLDDKEKFIEDVLSFDNPKVNKEEFLEDLISNQNIIFKNKSTLLRMLNDENQFSFAIKLYNKDFFKKNEQCEDIFKELEFETFCKIVSTYQMINEAYVGEEELEIKGLEEDLVYERAEVFKEAINTYKSLDKEKIEKLECFLSSELTPTRIKQLGKTYIKNQLSDSILNILIHPMLTDEDRIQDKIISLYEEVEEKEQFSNLVCDTATCINLLYGKKYYIDLLQEIVLSKFNEKTIAIFKEKIQLINSNVFMTNAGINKWYNTALNEMRQSYDPREQFQEQFDNVEDIDTFIEFLMQIKEKDGNCDLKPNTMVKKFNEVKPKSED